MASGPVAASVADLAAADDLRVASRIKNAWDAYHGKHPPSIKLRGQNSPNDNVKLNLSRLIVNRSRSFLFGKDVGCALSETDETEAEDWLTDCWALNRKKTTLIRLA